MQSKEQLIERTFEAVKGIRRAIVHLYNSTSTLQRRVVFGLDERASWTSQSMGRAASFSAPRSIRKPRWVFEYSPESFTGTELDFALEVCEAVMGAWGATPEAPSHHQSARDVEMLMPNIYADQIEWFSRTHKHARAR